MKYLRIALLFSSVLLSLLQSRAAQVTLTTIADPPEGGIVTGAGSYLSGATVPAVKIQANRGWYLSNVTYTVESNRFGAFPPSLDPAEYFQRLQFVAEQSAQGQSRAFDPTTTTNFTMDFFIIPGDCAVTGHFTSLVPAITQQPTQQIVVAGSSVVLKGGADGGKPIRYQWQRDEKDLPGQTSSNLVLSSVSLEDVGVYVLVARNEFGATKSAPAVLAVKEFVMFANGAIVTNTTVNTAFALTITFESKFQGGKIFYTLDGSEPDSNSIPFTGAFAISSAVTVRAIASSADSSEKVMLGSISIVTVPAYELEAYSWSVGGKVIVNPAQGPYQSNAVVTVVAEPWQGWTFMIWSGDLSGGNPTNLITMNGRKSIVALFGSTLTTSVTGNGALKVRPELDIYPAGINVEIIAVPAPGNRVVGWGGYAISNGERSSYEIGLFHDPHQIVSVDFGPLAIGQATLTVLTEGNGYVIPYIDLVRYPIGATNMLTASSDDQEFLGWKGDASGPNNPLPVVLDRSKTIIAVFTHHSHLEIERSKQIKVVEYGRLGDAYEIERSTDLREWLPIATMTNYTGSFWVTDPDVVTKPHGMYRAKVRDK